VSEDGELVDQMSDEEKRHDQLTSAPKSTEADAAPRIETSEHDGVTRIDIADTAAVRPGPVDDEDAALDTD
jgi:hypothetical protein